MADSLREDLIAQFTGVTGSDPERAQFYLESAAWNLDMAIASFYDGDDGDADMPAAPMPQQESTPPEATSRAQDPRAPQQPSRFATMGSMRQDEDSDNSEDGQAFYAGGSETSGQQVLGPPKKKKDPQAIVQDMFDQAREHGAEVVEGETSAAPRRGPPTFRGTGYKLGETEDGPVEKIAGAPVHDEPKQVDMTLKLWRSGFSIDDGPLRDYKDPANQEFLGSIKKGEVPRELTRSARGGEVNLNMEDHREEEYVKPKVPMKAFSGEGHRLGSPAGGVVAASAAAASPTQQKQNEDVAKSAVSVDAAQPTTQLQIRLSDGTRMVSKFNHSHTVGDVRRYINAARPEFTASTYVLMTTFPNKELTEETASLTSAGLLNAVLVQRMK